MDLTRRVFLFNQINNSNIGDSYVTDWLREVFGLHDFSNSSKEMLLPPFTKRMINYGEALCDFDFDFNFFASPIQTSNRLKLGSQVLCAEMYNKCGPPNS